MTFTAPLFPLNTVLFPGIPLHLHIFEERYKLMVNNCLTQKKPFGVVLIQEGTEALGPVAKPYTEGCLAQITEVQPLNDGRMNIVAVGTKRFHIDSLHTENNYLVGTLKLLPFNDTIANSDKLTRELTKWIEKYLKIVTTSEYDTIDISAIPKAPVELAYLAAYILNVPIEQKQEMLAINNAQQLFETVHQLYRRELSLLPALLNRTPSGPTAPFSAN
jgi:Lon protease-like protein